MIVRAMSNLVLKPDTITSLVLSFVLFPFVAGWLPMARFERERIEIQVRQTSVVVEGEYVYRNPWPFPVVQGFSIPFSVDSTHPPPVEVSAEELWPHRRLLSPRFVLGLHRFDLPLGPREEVGVRVRYEQYSPSADARYLLTTTQPWHRPLALGVYRIIPDGVEILSSNYPLRALEPGVLGFDRRDFMPREDWVFSWRAQ